MKIICIKDFIYSSEFRFKSNEIYDTVNNNDNLFLEIKNDFNKKITIGVCDTIHGIYSDYFIPLDKWRENQIESLFKNN